MLSPVSPLCSHSTLINLAGTIPNTSINGRLKYGSKGTPYVRINLTIPDSAGAWSFWP